MTTSAEEVTIPSPAVHNALQRWRIAAYAAGLGLLALITVIWIRKGPLDNPTPSSIWSPIHGFIYMIYLGLTIDLAMKGRWSIGRTLVLLAVTTVLPFVSFVAERVVTKRVEAGKAL